LLHAKLMQDVCSLSFLYITSLLFINVLNELLSLVLFYFLEFFQKMLNFMLITPSIVLKMHGKEQSLSIHY